MADPDLPEGFENWPPAIQSRFLEEWHALYFPRLRWWEKPESDEEDSGPRPKQLPPDDPRHCLPDNRGYRCGCSHGIPNCLECPPCPGNPAWSTWLCLTARGCVAGHTRIYLPLEDRHERIDVLAAAGKPITVLALTGEGPRPAVTGGAPFLKGVASLYEVRTGDGQVITVTDQHRFLTPQGWLRLADVREGQLLASGAPVPLGEVSPRSGLPRDGRRSSRTAPGSPARYPTYPGSCDPRLPAGPGSGRAPAPSRDGADGHTRQPWPADDQGISPGCSRLHPRSSRPARSSSSPAGPWPASVLVRVRSGAYGSPLPGIRRLRLSPGTIAAGSEAAEAFLRGGRDVSPRTASAASAPSWPSLEVALRQYGDDALSSGRTCRPPQRVRRGFPPQDSGGSVRQWAPGLAFAPQVASRPRAALAGARLSAGKLPPSLLAPGNSHHSGNGCGCRRVPAESTFLSYLDCIKWTRVLSVRPAGTGVFYDMHVPGPENYAAEGYYQHNTGKTKAGSNWTLEMALSRPDIHVGVCGPTYDDVRAVCLEGESGLIAEAKKNGIEIVDYNKNRQEVLLANGSKIRGFSAEKPDSIRGQNLSYVWFDELASIRYFGFFHEGLMPALRKGERPRLLITTTPKRIRLIRKLIEDSGYELTGKDGGPGTGVHLTQAISAENIHFSRIARERLEREYAGNPVMLQQELQGLLLADAAGSLFPIEQFNETRVYPAKDTLPQWRRVVIAVDPATTNKDTSDETGIVVTAEGDDGDFYVLEDCSGRFAPDQQMRVVAEAYYRHNADCVVGEVNMTGDYMRALLSTVDPNIPLRSVHGMKGKVSRAQGPSSLFMQGRIHMVGDGFRLLEDQLSAMAEGDDRNRMKDDRADSFVWSIIHLSGSGQGNWAQVYGFRDCVGCGSRVNEDKDLVCGHCGAKVSKQAPKHAGGRPAQVPWSEAYLKTCPKCETKYTPRERSCPSCAPSPETVIQRALAGPGGAGKLGYMGGNWLAGRRF